MNKKLVACDINEDFFPQTNSIGIQSFDSPSGKEEYFVEAPGINFQTPHQNAQLNYQDLWLKPGDRAFTFAEIKLDGEYFGNSTFQKKYIGKEFTVQLQEKVYSGEFKEKLIDLKPKN